MTALTQIEISREVGICVDRFTGTSSFNFFLIDAQPSHPARTERCVLSCLEQLHGMHSIDHVFIDFDGSGKSGSFEREIDVAPYRAFPNQSITKGITQSIVDQDLLSGGMAFAIICDPPARLEALDDMYCRTMQREFLNELNAEVGKIALASQVARALIRNDEDVDRLLSLVRLEMTHAEWAEDRDRLATIDPVEVLSPLRSAMQDTDAVAAAFSHYKETAMGFYEAGVTRTERMVQEAVRSMESSGGATGAIVLGIPRIDLVAALLRRANVGFVRITPEGVEPTSTLDEAGVSLGNVGEDLRRMTQLFSGQRVTDRTRIEAMTAADKESAKRRSEDLVTAAVDLGGRGDYTKAEELFDRAIELYPTPETLREAGIQATEYGSHKRAVNLLEQAIEENPKDVRNWEGYGVALEGLGDSERARAAFTKGIYLDPRSGRMWSQLGFHLHNRGVSEGGCYCFQKGKELGDPPSTDNFEMVCGPGGSRSVAPRYLRPSTVFLKRRFLLPLGRLFGRKLL